MICKKSPNNHGLDLWWIITYFSHCQRFNLFYLYLQIQNFILLTDIKFLTFKFRASTGSPALPCKYLILLAGSCFGIYQMSTSYSGQSHIIYKRLKNCNYLKYKLLHWPNYIVTLVKKKKEIPMDMSKPKGRIPLLCNTLFTMRVVKATLSRSVISVHLYVDLFRIATFTIHEPLV